MLRDVNRNKRCKYATFLARLTSTDGHMRVCNIKDTECKVQSVKVPVSLVV